MEIKGNASMIASQGLNNGYNQLNKIAQSINHDLVEQNADINQLNQNLPVYSPVDHDALNSFQNPSLENNLVELSQTKVQMLSLMKVLEVEQENFDSSLGKIFDNWA